jgi:hypothetical protein
MQRLTPADLRAVTKCLHLSCLSTSLVPITTTSIPAETAMKTPILSLICIACILNAGDVATNAQTPDSTAPCYDMKAQALLDLEAVNKKCVDLAEALPSDKLTWRPSADTRSFAEVFLHVAG